MKTYSRLYCNSQFSITVTLLIWAILKVFPAQLETIAKTDEIDIFSMELEELEDKIEILRMNPTPPDSDAFAVLSKSNCPEKLLGSYDCWNVNGECYCLIMEMKSWWAALNFCRQYGMELISFETKEEETNFTKSFQSHLKSKRYGNFHYLTSGNRLNGNRTGWMWAGSGTLLNWNLNWMKNEPTGKDKNGQFHEECLNVFMANLSDDVSWNDVDCSYSTLYFICEFSLTKNQNP